MKADVRWIDDPEVFRVNQSQAHSDHTYYGSRQEMEGEGNSLIQSLNGQWKFCYSVNPASRPELFYQEAVSILMNLCTDGIEASSGRSIPVFGFK